jgi:ribonucleoside-diphosphate reductase beta chain
LNEVCLHNSEMIRSDKKTQEEYLTLDEHKRYTIHPIVHDDIWKFYCKQRDSFWTVQEVDLSKDIDDWKKMSDPEKFFITNVLAFFAGSDGVVLDNICSRFLTEITVLEVKYFYVSQMSIENIHSEMYSVLIDTLVATEKEKHHLFNAMDTIPCVKKKTDWAIKWMEADSSLGQRLLAFAIVEGIFFSGSFCSIFWLKKRGLMPGLAFSNEFISRDESLHTEFACLLLTKYVEHKPSLETAHMMIKNAVEIETEFIIQSIPVELIGMNSSLMGEYIKFVADRLSDSLGYGLIYGSKNPFDFMDMISMSSKSNFFERRVSDYRKGGFEVSDKDVFSFTSAF